MTVTMIFDCSDYVHKIISVTMTFVIKISLLWRIRVLMIQLQDTLISFEEFVQIMDASDVEHKMSMKFVG